MDETLPSLHYKCGDVGIAVMLKGELSTFDEIFRGEILEFENP